MVAIKKKYILVCFTFLIILFSCQFEKIKSDNKNEENTKINFAKGFQIEDQNEIQKIIIKSPYQNSEEVFEYLLSRNKNLKKELRIPISRIVVTSTTHIPMIELLNEENSIVGFPNVSYISSQKTRQRVEQGFIKEIGKDWAAQRIKGLSLTSALFFALFPNSKRKPKTLIDVFYYPRLGAGMLWEKFEDFLNTNGVEVKKNSYVTGVKEKGDKQILKYTNNGVEKIISADHVLFSNPLLDFINADYTYAADFDWQASSQSYIDKIGNVIQNSNTHNLGLDVDFTKFYKNIGLTKLFSKKESKSDNTPESAIK